jgi:GT2 family glycosyltransferase
MNDYPQWQQRRRDFRSAAAHDDSGMWNFMFSLGIEMDAQADCPGRLARTLASLRQQSFRNVEILVLGGGGPGTSLAPTWIASFMSFRGLFHEPALTAVDLLNQPAADRRWRGDYLMSIPAGATVDADAFACLNRAINAAAATALPDLVLCDYDQLNPDGQCSAPVFSPGWDPDFLLAQDYLGPAFLVARDLLSRHRCQAGACGSLWEWLKSLALPGVPLATCHVCEPLLHLPAPGPAGLAVPPATIAHPLPEPLPGIAVIIPCKDHPELLERCLDFLRFETRIPLEIVIVDNASTTARTLALYAELQERHQAKIVTMDAPFNFSRMINLGVAASSSAVLLLLNNDVEISRPGTLEQLLAQACRPEVGMVGSKLLYPDGTVQHAGTLLGAGGESETRQDHYYIARHVMRGAEGDAPGYLGNLQTIRNYQAVTGALLMLRRQVFEQIGGFNEIELPVEYNDIDYCLRVRQAGYRVVCLPIAGVYHREAATRTLENPPETVAMRHRAVAYMKSRWLDAFEVDPYDNPRIHLGDSAKPSLGSPWSR